MSKRLNLHHLGITGVTAFALTTSLLLSACQSKQDAPSTDDTEQTTQDQNGSSTSNTEGSQGGAVVNANDPNGGHSQGSTKTGFDDLWMLDKVSTSDGTTIYDHDEILYYGTTYEVVLAIEFSEADGEKYFACTLPGIDLTGNWEETSETQASLDIPLFDNTVNATYEMSDDHQTAELRLGQLTDSGIATVYHFHRDDDPTLTVSDMYEAMVKNNDQFYDELPTDTENDLVFVDDDKVRLRLIGTTHTDNMVGYLIEATNKTDTLLIINDFAEDPADHFTVNGSTEAKALAGRVLPPAQTDADTGEQLLAPMRCAILFFTDDIGNQLTSASGNILITDYHWNQIGQYAFSMGQ